MGANPTEKHVSLGKLKREAVIHRHRTFPAIHGPYESFNAEGRVEGIFYKNREFCFEDVPIPPQGFP